MFLSDAVIAMSEALCVVEKKREREIVVLLRERESSLPRHGTNLELGLKRVESQHRWDMSNESVDASRDFFANFQST